MCCAMDRLDFGDTAREYRVRDRISPMKSQARFSQSARKDHWLRRGNTRPNERCASVTGQLRTRQDWRLVGLNCHWLQATPVASIANIVLTLNTRYTWRYVILR